MKLTPLLLLPLLLPPTLPLPLPLFLPFFRWNAIMEVMDLVEKEAALSPLQVLAILALNPKLPLYVAAGFIGNTFKDLSDDINTVEGEVEAAMRNIQTISHSNVNQVWAALRPACLASNLHTQPSLLFACYLFPSPCYPSCPLPSAPCPRRWTRGSASSVQGSRRRRTMTRTTRRMRRRVTDSRR
jgi:hypothetical protein